MNEFTEQRSDLQNKPKEKNSGLMNRRTLLKGLGALLGLAATNAVDRSGLVALARGITSDPEPFPSQEIKRTRVWSQDFSKTLDKVWPSKTLSFINEGMLKIASGNTLETPPLPDGSFSIQMELGKMNDNTNLDIVVGGIDSYQGLDSTKTKIIGENPFTISLTSEEIYFLRTVKGRIKDEGGVDTPSQLSTLDIRVYPKERNK